MKISKIRELTAEDQAEGGQMIERKRPRRWCKGRVTKMFKAFLAEEEEDEYEIVKVAPLGVIIRGELLNS